MEPRLALFPFTSAILNPHENPNKNKRWRGKRLHFPERLTELPNLFSATKVNLGSFSPSKRRW